MTKQVKAPQLCRSFLALGLSISVALLDFSWTASASLSPELPSRTSLSSNPWTTIEKKVSVPGAAKKIFFIQDAHDSLEAQLGIASMIDWLVAHENVVTVYEEGYEGPVPTDAYFHPWKDRAAKREVAFELLKRLRLSAAEFAHINRKHAFKILGADSRRLHKQNLSAARHHFALQSQIEKQIRKIRSEILTAVNQASSSEARKWLRAREDYENAKIDAASYLNLLAAQYLKRNAPESFAQQFSAIAALMTKQAEFSFDAIYSDWRRLEMKVAFELFETELGQQAFAFLEDVEWLERLVKLQLRAGEFEDARKILRRSTTEKIGGFLLTATGKPVVLPQRWESQIQWAVKFYETALQRDQVMERSLQAFAANKKERSAVLVYGGFHRPAIEAALQKLGISYAVLSPKMHQVDLRQAARYQKLLRYGYYAFERPFAVHAVSTQTIFNLISAQNLPRYARQMKADLAPAQRSEVRLSQNLQFYLVQQGKELPTHLPEGLRLDLVEQALLYRRLPVAKLPEPQRKLLLRLRSQGITDFVLMGGAVKDIFFNLEPHDFDFSFAVPLNESMRQHFSRSGAMVPENVYREVYEKLQHFAKAWNVDAEKIISSRYGEPRLKFDGRRLEYFGPLPAKTRSGARIILTNYLAESQTRAAYHNPGAVVLKIGIDPEGNLYGPVDKLVSLLLGELWLEGDLRNLSRSDLLRIIRLNHQVGLKLLTDDDRSLLKVSNLRMQQPLSPSARRILADIPPAAHEDLKRFGFRSEARAVSPHRGAWMRALALGAALLAATPAISPAQMNESQAGRYFQAIERIVNSYSFSEYKVQNLMHLGKQAAPDMVDFMVSGPKTQWWGKGGDEIVTVLVALNDEASIGRIVSHFKEKDLSYRQKERLIQVLTQMKSEAAFRALLQLLNEKPDDMIALALVAKKDPRALPALMRAIELPEQGEVRGQSYVPVNAGRVLDKLDQFDDPLAKFYFALYKNQFPEKDSPEFIPEARRLLRSNSQALRTGAYQYLTAKGEMGTWNFLRYYSKEHPIISLVLLILTGTALFYIASQTSKKLAFESLLKRALEKEDASVQSQLLYHLNERHDISLDDRLRVLQALGKLRRQLNQETVQSLIDLAQNLHAQHHHLRIHAIRAFAGAEPMDLTLPILLNLLNDRELSVREAAQQGMAWIDHPKAKFYTALLGEDLPTALTIPGTANFALEAIKNKNPQIRLQAIRVLQRHPNWERLIELVPLLQDPKEVPDVRSLSALVLGTLPAAQPVLIAALAIEDTQVQAAVVGALRDSGNVEALHFAALYEGRAQDLVGIAEIEVFAREALAHPSPKIRQSAAQLLGLIRDEESANQLFQQLSDPNAEVALNAARALQRLHNPRGLFYSHLYLRQIPAAEAMAERPRWLEEALSHPAWNVRHSAMEIVASLKDQQLGELIVEMQVRPDNAPFASEYDAILRTLFPGIRWDVIRRVRELAPKVIETRYESHSEWVTSYGLYGEDQSYQRDWEEEVNAPVRRQAEDEIVPLLRTIATEGPAMRAAGQYLVPLITQDFDSVEAAFVAIETLAAIDYQDGIDTLARALDNHKLQLKAAEALRSFSQPQAQFYGLLFSAGSEAAMNMPDAKRLLHHTLTESGFRLQEAALRVLVQDEHDPSFIPALGKILAESGKYDSLKREAIRALAGIGSDQAIPLLIRVAAQYPYDFHHQVKDALEKIGPVRDTALIPELKEKVLKSPANGGEQALSALAPFAASHFTEEEWQSVVAQYSFPQIAQIFKDLPKDLGVYEKVPTLERLVKIHMAIEASLQGIETWTAFRIRGTIEHAIDSYRIHIAKRSPTEDVLNVYEEIAAFLPSLPAASFQQATALFSNINLRAKIFEPLRQALPPGEAFNKILLLLGHGNYYQQRIGYQDVAWNLIANNRFADTLRIMEAMARRHQHKTPAQVEGFLKFLRDKNLSQFSDASWQKWLVKAEGEKKRSEMREADFRFEADAIENLSSRYLVRISLEDFAALSASQRQEFYKQIDFQSRDRKVVFQFVLPDDDEEQPSPSLLSQLQTFKRFYRNVEIVAPETLFSAGRRTILNVAVNGRNPFESKAAPSSFTLNYSSHSREPGLLTAALLLLDANRLDFFTQRTLSELPSHLQAGVQSFLSHYRLFSASA